MVTGSFLSMAIVNSLSSSIVTFLKPEKGKLKKKISPQVPTVNQKPIDTIDNGRPLLYKRHRNGRSNKLASQTREQTRRRGEEVGKKKRRVNQSFGGVGEDPGQVTVLSDSAGKKMRCWHSNSSASATCGEKNGKV